MDWSLNQAYYLVASVSGIVATSISLVIFFRSRPDRLKQKVVEVLEPLATRVQTLERGQAEIAQAQAEAAKQHAASVRALDHEVSERLKEFGLRVDGQYRELSAALATQSSALERIATKIESGISRRDIEVLHTRISKTAESVAAMGGVMERLVAQVTHIDDFIRSGNHD